MSYYHVQGLGEDQYIQKIIHKSPLTRVEKLEISRGVSSLPGLDPV